MLKKIVIPHVNYIVEFGLAKGKDKLMMERKSWGAMARSNGKGLTQILFLKPLKKTDFPTLAHEVMHVLQYIAEEKSIDMAREYEHFGYLMQYILNEILGYKYT